MKPIEFKEQNVVFAKDQPEYLPLPAYKAGDGLVIACWKASFADRLLILFTGKVWIHQLTFNQALQPQRVEATNPFEDPLK